jgi:hypothetical protein
MRWLRPGVAPVRVGRPVSEIPPSTVELVVQKAPASDRGKNWDSYVQESNDRKRSPDNAQKARLDVSAGGKCHPDMGHELAAFRAMSGRGDTAALRP